MACPHHASPEQVQSFMCWSCYTAQKNCDHCKANKAAVDVVFSCKESQCKNKIYLCKKCAVMPSAAGIIYCKTCWYANGMLCIYCNTQKGRTHLHLLRGCKQCVQRYFCKECSSPPSSMAELPTCL
eukprot:11741923-Karenia_brevis.AAC.1